MKDGQAPPIDDRWGRWVARTGEASPEARAGALLRQAAVSEAPLDADRLAAIRHRLRGARRWPQRHWALRFAIAVGLLLSGGVLTAAGQRYLHLFVPRRPAPPEVRAPAAPHAPHAGVTARAPLLALAPEPEPVVPPEPTSTSAPRRPELALPRHDPVSLMPMPPPTSEPVASALAQESKLLAEALQKLRHDGDGPGALALLDEHDARFAAGALAPEATRARIEALIKTRRNGDALALLDRIAPSPRGSGRDLLIARAELRAAAGRCADASTDFDLLLRRDPAPDSITERALWGRASCRAAASDATGARNDLRDYLGLFPEGRFAGDARAALGR